MKLAIESLVCVLRKAHDRRVVERAAQLLASDDLFDNYFFTLLPGTGEVRSLGSNICVTRTSQEVTL